MWVGAARHQTHVRKVLQLCANMGVRPMMYSDMLFSLMPVPHDELIQAEKKVCVSTNDVPPPVAKP